MRRPFWLVPLCLVSFLVGCGKEQHVHVVPRPKTFRAIVSLSPSSTELFASNSFDSQLKGRTASDNFPTSVATIPVVLVSTKPDMEKLRAIKPDLVLYDNDLFSEQDLAPIKELGATTFAISAKTVKDFEKQIFELSSLVGSETYYSSYVQRIDSARVKASGPTQKVAVIMPGPGGGYIAGTKSFVADVIRTVGGEPVGPDAEKFVQINIEQVVQANPDRIIIPSSKAKATSDVEAILNDPRLRTTNAVKNRAIIPLESDVVLRRGGRVDKFLDNARRALTLESK